MRRPTFAFRCIGKTHWDQNKGWEWEQRTIGGEPRCRPFDEVSVMGSDFGS